MAFNDIFTWFQSLPTLLGYHSNIQTDKNAKDDTNTYEINIDTFPDYKQIILENAEDDTNTYAVNIDTFPDYKQIISEKQDLIRYRQKMAKIIEKQKLDAEKQKTLEKLAKFNVYKPIVDELINKWSNNIIPEILGKIHNKFKNTELNGQYIKTKPSQTYDQQLKHKYLKHNIATYSIPFSDIGKLINDNIKFTDIESKHWNQKVFNDMIISKFKDELDNIKEYIIKILYEKGYPEVNIYLITNYNNNTAFAITITNYIHTKQ